MTTQLLPSVLVVALTLCTAERRSRQLGGRHLSEERPSEGARPCAVPLRKCCRRVVWACSAGAVGSFSINHFCHRKFNSATRCMHGRELSGDFVCVVRAHTHSNLLCGCVSCVWSVRPVCGRVVPRVVWTKRAQKDDFALTRARAGRRRRTLAVYRRDRAQKHGHHQWPCY